MGPALQTEGAVDVAFSRLVRWYKHGFFSWTNAPRWALGAKNTGYIIYYFCPWRESDSPVSHDIARTCFFCFVLCGGSHLSTLQPRCDHCHSTNTKIIGGAKPTPEETMDLPRCFWVSAASFWTFGSFSVFCLSVPSMAAPGFAWLQEEYFLAHQVEVAQCSSCGQQTRFPRALGAKNTRSIGAVFALRAAWLRDASLRVALRLQRSSQIVGDSHWPVWWMGQLLHSHLSLSRLLGGSLVREGFRSCHEILLESSLTWKMRKIIRAAVPAIVRG